MRCLASIRLLTATALIVAGLAYGCGRTSLDDGFVPVESGGGTGAGGDHPQGGASGQAGRAGSGGRGGTAGNPGIGGAIGFNCLDSTSCPGNQVCCLGVSTFSSSCLPPAQCAGVTQLILCRSDAACPSTIPSCCIVPAYGLGACVPRGTPCTPR
jgi:hypothetical protein